MSKLFNYTAGGLTLAAVTNYFWSSSSASATTTGSTDSNAPGSTAIAPSSRPNLPTVSPVNPQEFFKYGFPGPVHDLQTHQEFISCYDRSTRNPYYVIEHINASSIKSPDGGVDRKKSIFKEDEAIPAKFRATLRDYFRSGYDRGHQAPAADAKFNQQAMNETFYLTNISPQQGEGFNREYWAYLEQFCRDLTKKYRDVRIVTGPLYLPKRDPDGKYRVHYEVIGNPPNIAVPTHFYKLVVCEDGSNDLRVAAFVLPNAVIDNKTPLKSFEVPVESLERSSGLNFLQNVNEKNKKSLCKEVTCEITVREYNDAKQKLLPGK
ncbi:hypothetical protein WICPIJ_009657 [Wickerhamomyces pijperi]|uniref:Endonuclease n=1 Tax=Wickerhamomyces pijperi TaxID=599730 RepID=A0A9P8PL02_WICPI|nr:hypothetical protein WICPIJ_009657 [Wickerhamomyces pijperi]